MRKPRSIESLAGRERPREWLLDPAAAGDAGIQPPRVMRGSLDPADTGDWSAREKEGMQQTRTIQADALFDRNCSTEVGRRNHSSVSLQTFMAGDVPTLSAASG